MRFGFFNYLSRLSFLPSELVSFVFVMSTWFAYYKSNHLKTADGFLGLFQFDFSSVRVDLHFCAHYYNLDG